MQPIRYLVVFEQEYSGKTQLLKKLLNQRDFGIICSTIYHKTAQKQLLKPMSKLLIR